MVEQPATSKAELLIQIERAWGAINAALHRLTEHDLATIKDPQGWTVKDHLLHLTAWEHSVICFLQGEARHRGLGIDESHYLTGNEETINAAIYQRQHDVPVHAALDQFRATHQALVAMIQSLTDADLQRPYREYLPEEPGDGDGPPASRVIYNNAVHHFYEHLAWIESLVGSASAVD